MSQSTDRLAQLSSQEKRSLLTERLRQKADETRVTYSPSYGQKALWFLHQNSPESAAYNTAFAGRIRSRVDAAALERACQALVLRHPALRACFPAPDGAPVQEVRGYHELDFAVIDAGADGPMELRQRVIAAYERPFDLENGPLFRVMLFTSAPEDHVLLLTLHHIISDAWSIWTLLDELRVLYPAKQSGKRADLSALNGQYADYVHWQTELLASALGERLWCYWRDQLASPLPTLNLATDRPPDSTRAFRGASYFFKLAPTLGARVRELARAQGVTLFTVLLAVFQVLLQRYSGQDDIIVGTPTSGRSQPEFAGIVGYFVNPIALRANLSAAPAFQTFLHQTRDTVLAGIAHQEYPFPLLVERLQPTRDASRSPVFQALFALQKPQERDGLARRRQPGASAARLNLGDLVVEPLKLPQMEGQFELTLEITDMGDALDAIFKYDPAQFDETTIARMAGHYENLLHAAVARPETSIADLPLLEAAERHQLLVEWNATQREYPLDRCLHHWFEDQVARAPDAIAVQFPSTSSGHNEDQCLTYRELNARANQLAHRLHALGVGPQTLVGVCMERSLEMVTALYGVLKAGGAYVPLDPAYPKERLAFMLTDAQTPVLLTQRALLSKLPEHSAHVLCLDADLESIEQESTENPASENGPDDLAYMIYTSGSTGKPKGALNTHRGICNRLFWMQEEYRLTPDDRVLQKTPFSFDVSVWEFFWPLLNGARLVVAQPDGHLDSAYLADLIRAQQITTLHFVPSMLQLFLEEPGIETCTSLRRVICSGEALPYDLQERFFTRLDAELHNLYGPTEASIDVTYWRCRREDGRRTVPIGLPVANTQIYVLDPQLQPVPIGVPGELYIGGVQVGRGYHNRPKLTAEKFIADPFRDEPQAMLYKTGDLTRFRPDGNLEYLGRIDFQAKIRGFRIELGEIEALLVQYPAVREAVVIVHQNGAGDKRLIAYIVQAESQALQPGSGQVSNLQTYLQAKLPFYMIPSAIIQLDVMPLMPNGKVNRRALPAPQLSHPERATPLVQPQTEAEQQIAEIWRQVLQVETVALHDNFFDLGGHSLLLGRVRNKVHTVFGRALTMVEMFKYPTVQSLARCVTAQSAPAAQAPPDQAASRRARQAATRQQRQLRKEQRST